MSARPDLRSSLGRWLWRNFPGRRRFAAEYATERAKDRAHAYFARMERIARALS